MSQGCEISAARSMRTEGVSLRTLPPAEALRRVIPLATLFFLTLAVFSINHNFRLGLHPDEVPWISDVVTSHWELEQPLLLRELTRAVVRALQIVDPQRAVEIGRSICAVTASFGVVGLYLISRQRAGERAALISAGAAALTPLLAIHAHYFKDDVPLFACCTLTIVMFRRFLADDSRSNVAFLGICLGAAVSSKESGLFLLPLLAISALFQPSDGWRRRLVGLAAAGVIASAVVAVANAPMLLDLARTSSELGAETKGIFEGHWDGVVYALGFHFTHSLRRGVGPLFLALAGGGLLLATLRRHLADPMDRLMVIYAVIYYGIIELSPMKPWPDPDRYALPLLVPLSYFFGVAIAESSGYLRERFPNRRAVLPLYAVVAVVVVLTARPTFRLVAELGDDTRYAADRILSGKGPQIVTEAYGTSFGQSVRSLADLDLPKLNPDIRYLVASSFVYGRFAYGARVGGVQNAGAAGTWARYRELFRHPYCELRPRFMSYAFSNPTIRIIDLKAPPESNAIDGNVSVPICADGISQN
jgi:hypothetical protein